MVKRVITAALCIMMVMAIMGTVCVWAETVEEIEAPKNLTVQLKEYEDGYPYFQLNMELPDSVVKLGETVWENDGELFFGVESKIGNSEWRDLGDTLFNVGQVFDIDPEDMGIGTNIDIKANVYEFRVRLVYYLTETNEDGNRVNVGTVYSPYSNVASIGIKAYYKEASQWAVQELDRAAEYGFITEKIREKMNGPITREELCEVIMKLYEKMIGEATYQDMSAFTDTKNPEIFKAYELGIVSGVGNGKFAPTQLTNREQVAVMMHNAVKKIKPDADFNIDGVGNFKDEKLISSWALQSVKFMNKNGLIIGSNGNVDPKGTTTREQAVLIVVRTYEKYSDIKNDN